MSRQFVFVLAACCFLAATVHAQEALEGHSRGVLRIAYSPDGATIATGGEDSTVRLWDAKTKKELATLKGHTGELNGLAFSPDGKTLATADFHKSLRVWDVATKKSKKPVEVPNPVLFLAFSPDGKSVFITGREPKVVIWSLGATDKQVPGSLRLDNQTTGLAFSRDGKMLVTADEAGEVILWSMDSDGGGKAPGGDAKPAPDAIPEFLPSDDEPKKPAAPTGPGKEFKRGKHGDLAKAAAFAPDGKRFATGGGNGSVKLWSAETGEEVEGFSCPDLDVNALAFTPDGKTLIAGTQDGLLKFIDPATGDVRKSEQVHDSPIAHLAVSPDGKTAATASLDGTVKFRPVE